MISNINLIAKKKLSDLSLNRVSISHSAADFCLLRAYLAGQVSCNVAPGTNHASLLHHRSLVNAAGQYVHVPFAINHISDVFVLADERNRSGLHVCTYVHMYKRINLDYLPLMLGI